MSFYRNDPERDRETIMRLQAEGDIRSRQVMAINKACIAYAAAALVAFCTTFLPFLHPVYWAILAVGVFYIVRAGFLSRNITKLIDEDIKKTQREIAVIRLMWQWTAYHDDLSPRPLVECKVCDATLNIFDEDTAYRWRAGHIRKHLDDGTLQSDGTYTPKSVDEVVADDPTRIPGTAVPLIPGPRNPEKG